jgi:glutamyl/glutaminyl-tRNA synthetase
MLTRFAPAPTGYLHLGHVVNALYVWGMARAASGRVLLRIENHDRQRCRPEYEASILEDLAWLGFAPDVIAPRQSERDAAYRAALQPLVAAGFVYGCSCTRKDVSGLRYPGTCRDRGIPLGDNVGWRVRIEPGNESFHDLGHTERLLCGRVGPGRARRSCRNDEASAHIVFTDHEGQF